MLQKCSVILSGLCCVIMCIPDKATQRVTGDSCCVKITGWMHIYLNWKNCKNDTGIQILKWLSFFYTNTCGEVNNCVGCNIVSTVSLPLKSKIKNIAFISLSLFVCYDHRVLYTMFHPVRYYINQPLMYVIIKLFSVAICGIIYLQYSDNQCVNIYSLKLYQLHCTLRHPVLLDKISAYV